MTSAERPRKMATSANAAVAATEGDTVTAHTTSGGITYRVEHVSFAVNSANDTCSGKWAVDSGATEHVADPGSRVSRVRRCQININSTRSAAM